MWLTVHNSLAALILFINSIFCLQKIKINEQGYFIDDSGYVKLFHGFNSVVKSPPWYDPQADNITRLKLFKEWGINVIRLGVIWSAVYSAESVVNETYLSKIESIIERAGEHGIYIILDMHQDVLSERFGTYDGIPGWLLDKLPQPPVYFRYPWPFKNPPSQWFEGYLTYACAEAAQQLYKNVSSALDHWGNYWATLAAKFGSLSNVLGYELINEPPPGNFFTNPLRALPGISGKYDLLSAYDYLVKRIRIHDTKSLIFYEPVTYGIFGFGTGPLGTGFNRVPGSESTKSVLSYHHYCWLVQTVDPLTIMPKWKEIFCDNVLLPHVFEQAKNVVSYTGGGRFLTEFGLCAPDGNPLSINTLECNAILDKADEYFESWTYWDGNCLDEHGNPINEQLKSFARVYPQSTFGIPKKLKFDHKIRHFYYSFELRKSLPIADSVTIAQIVVPMSIHYPDGLVIQTIPEKLNTSQSGHIITIYANTAVLQNFTQVEIMIRPSVHY